MKRKKPINLDFIKKIEPLTDNQQVFFDSYKEDKNLVAYGCAGTGKTFITLYNALMDVLDPKSPYEKIYIVRSLVAGQGSKAEKLLKNHALTLVDKIQESINS